MNIEQIAAIAHEVNRVFCLAHKDYSQPEWELAPDWQRESAINGVIYHLKNPDALPEDSHNNWMREKISNGWKFGEIKNPDKKEHPCIMPYDDLPIEQRTKDYLFIAVVKSLKPYLA